jgi:hypothetical protein
MKLRKEREVSLVILWEMGGLKSNYMELEAIITHEK